MSEFSDKLARIYAKIEKLAVNGKEKTQDYYLLVDDFVSKGDYGYFETALYYYYYIDIYDIVSLDDVKKKTWPEILFQTTTPFLKKLSRLYKTKNIYQQSYDIHSMDPNTVQINLSQPLSSTFSTISTTQSIGFSRQNESIRLNIVNTNTKKVTIYKSDWELDNGVEKPINSEFLQKIEISASFSSYTTEIPTTQGDKYWISTQQVYIPGMTGSFAADYNYKLEITKDSLLGQIREIEININERDYQQSPRLQRLNKEIITSIQVDKVGATQSIIISQENSELTYDSNLLEKYKLAIDYLLS